MSHTIILAAGRGKRLHRLTKDTPKCMVKLFGKSLLENQIEIFHKCGITDISVVKGYLGEKINFPNINYFVNQNYDSTNMVETLFCARDVLINSVIISYGDIIFEKKVLEKLISSSDDISIVVDQEWEKYWKIRFENPLDDAESMMINNEGHIQSIGQRVSNIDEIYGQYIGLMKFSPVGLEKLLNFYDYVKKESKKQEYNLLNSKLPFEQSYMTDLLQGLISQGHPLKAVLIKNGWLELDRINDFRIYNQLYKNGMLKEFYNE